MISASGVECETAVCFFDCAAKGADVLGPAIFRKVPDVDRDVLRSDAKVSVRIQLKEQFVRTVANV